MYRICSCATLVAALWASSASAQLCDDADLLGTLPLAGTVSFDPIQPADPMPGDEIIIEGFDVTRLYSAPASDRLYFRFFSHSGSGSSAVLTEVHETRDYVFLDPYRIRVQVPADVPSGSTRVGIWFEFTSRACPPGARWAGVRLGLGTTPTFTVVAPPPPSPPPAVSVLGVHQVSEDEVTVWWEGVAEADGYRIRHRALGDASWREFAISWLWNSHRIVNLQANTTYEIVVVAFNRQGDAPSSAPITVLTLNAPPRPPEIPDIEETWVLVHDHTTTVVQGVPSWVPPTPLSRSYSGQAYAAQSVTGYTDINDNGRIDIYQQVGASILAPFPMTTETRPATPTSRSYENVLGALLLGSGGTWANIAVKAVLPQTVGSRGHSTFVSLQLSYDATSNQIEFVDFRGGDWNRGDGKTMTTAQLFELSPTTTVVPATSQSHGLIRGRVRARLIALETFYYIDPFGNPATGVLQHEADVEFAFAAPLFTE